MNTVDMMRAMGAFNKASAAVQAGAAAIVGGQVAADVESIAAFIAPRVESEVQAIPLAKHASADTIGRFVSFLASVALDTARMQSGAGQDDQRSTA